MAEHRHKRETNARRFNPFRARAVVVAGPLAFLATASAVTLGVLATSPEAPDFLSAQSASGAADTGAENPLQLRREPVSRGASRIDAAQAKARAQAKAAEAAAAKENAKPTKLELVLSEGQTQKAIKKADRKLWTMTTLNLWTTPADDAKNVGELAEGTRVLVTGRSLLGRDEVVLEGKSRWVTSGYLSEEEPFALGGDCTNGSSVPEGVSENIKKVHAAVCAEFPEITSYGTFRSDGEHGQGIAIDIMVSGERGWQVAEFVRKYYVELGVSYLIYSQQIWSVERGGEGWRSMEDRGSTTANHYDHVHVTTY